MKIEQGLVTDFTSFAVLFQTDNQISHSRVTRLEDDYKFIIAAGMKYMLGMIRNLEEEKRSILEQVGK